MVLTNRIGIIQAELTGDPLGLVYSGMNDAAAAASLNTINRDADGSIVSLFNYLLVTRAHTNQGNDTAALNGTPSTILGRLIIAAEQTGVPADPFGAGDTPSTKTMNSRELHSAKAFWAMIQAGLVSEVNFTDTEQGDMLNDLIEGGIMNTAHRTAIIALSQSKQSRAQELGLGEVSESDIWDARNN